MQWLSKFYSSPGPELPYGIRTSAMAQNPDGNGIILFGGVSSFGMLDSILELKSDDQGWVGAWTILTTKLQFPRAYHVVIPVLMDKNICGLNGIVSDAKLQLRYERNHNASSRES